MKTYDDWKTDAPDDGCEREECVEQGECTCAEDLEDERISRAEHANDDARLREMGFDV